jgi:hypothetical protein
LNAPLKNVPILGKSKLVWLERRGARSIPRLLGAAFAAVACACGSASENGTDAKAPSHDASLDQDASTVGDSGGMPATGGTGGMPGTGGAAGEGGESSTGDASASGGRSVNDATADAPADEPDADANSTTAVVCSTALACAPDVLESWSTCPRHPPDDGAECDLPAGRSCYYCDGPEATWSDAEERVVFRCRSANWAQSMSMCGS